MRAYKGFNESLTCRGYQFREGITHVTDKANCVENGFHCAENPLDCFSYYRDWKKSVYYIVEAAGDLDEDGRDTKISCTEMTLVKKLTMGEMTFEVTKYFLQHPGRIFEPGMYGPIKLALDKSVDGDFVIVRGKDPVAAGPKGSIVALLKEKKSGKEIKEAVIFKIPEEGTYYRVHYGKAVKAGDVI